MPTVSLDREDLYAGLGRTFTEKELDELCFDYGLELDEWDETSERPTVKIEVPANRYDMLCLEGIVRALAIYLGKVDAPKFKVVTPEKPITLTIEKEVAQVRPYATAAVLRGVKFTQRRYESFIALQDKLHSNLCRNRSLVAIGTHDLDKVKGNVRYRGLAPSGFSFAPLNQSKVMTGEEVLEFYRGDRNLSKFVPLIENAPVLPVFVDEEDSVLSLPPLINSDKTKITLDTRDIFFDITATDLTKMHIVVNQMVAMFAEFASEPFTVEAVEVIQADGEKFTAPDLSSRTMQAEVAYLNSVLGLEESADSLAKLLAKMGLSVDSSKSDDKVIEVIIPASRPDILHPCDIVEEAGIGYGFNNLKKEFTKSSALVGEPLPINKLGDIFRTEAYGSGWSEVLPLTLSSIEENFDWLRRKDDGTAIHLENPKTAEYQVVRTTLYPGIFKTIKENRMHALPIKVFEVGEVVFKDMSKERRATQKKHFSAVFAGKTSGFEIVHGLLDRLMKMLRYSGNTSADRSYWLEESEHSFYFPGRAADILIKKDGQTRKVGHLGVVHPEVLQKFEIPFVLSGLELDVSEFL